MTRGVVFAPGTVVSPGEYRNIRTGEIRYFDGSTPLPGGVNSAPWQQVSDHYHAHPAPPVVHGQMPETPTRPVRFAPGTVVSPGEYRNTRTGEIRYFDGKTALPGGVNSAPWQQVSDHYHAHPAPPVVHGQMPETPTHPVLFAPGTVVSPGEYRNTRTGEIRYFDGNTPLPGGVNSAPWQQVSDHYHAEMNR